MEKVLTTISILTMVAAFGCGLAWFARTSTPMAVCGGAFLAIAMVARAFAAMEAR